MAAMQWKLKLSKRGPVPIYQQVVDLVTEAVRAGRLEPGERVPSVADLAGQWKVNKATVVRAFRELESRGLLVAQVGRGSFVAAGAVEAAGNGHAASKGAGPHGGTSSNGETGATPLGDGAAGSAAAAAAGSLPLVRRSLRALRSSYADGVAQLVHAGQGGGTLNLRGGLPAVSHVERGLLEQLTAQVCAGPPDRLAGYTHEGLPELRAAICDVLNRRGHDFVPEQILVTNGSQEAVSVLAIWSRDAVRRVLCETPTFIGVPQAFSLCGHVVESVAWNGWSQFGQRLHDVADAAVLIYTCPEFHNPTGECLGPDERAGLVRAAERGAVVVVDDIFRDLRFAGTTLDSLYEALPAGRRVLVGSFSKTFIPGVRVGFLAAERPLLEELSVIRRYLNLGGPALIQALMTRFLEDHYEEHLRRVRPFYRKCCRMTCKFLEEHLPESTRFTRPEGGFQLWVQMPAGYSAIDVYLQALERGVAISPGPAHDIDGRYLNCFRLGYACGSSQDLSRGLKAVAGAVRDIMERGPSEPAAGGIGLLV